MCKQRVVPEDDAGNRNKKSKRCKSLRNVAFNDMYAEEIRFNLKGKTSVASPVGSCLSFLVRALVFSYIIERLVAWYGLSKFKITSYESALTRLQAMSRLGSHNFKLRAISFCAGFGLWFANFCCDRSMPKYEIV